MTRPQIVFLAQATRVPRSLTVPGTAGASPLPDHEAFSVAGYPRNLQRWPAQNSLTSRLVTTLA
jgi:hypothetical protein